MRESWYVNWRLLFSLFTDPILRGPVLGSMLMCLSAALVGTLVFVRRNSLLGEALSHATYPGVILAVLLSTFFSHPWAYPVAVLGGAFVAALIGWWLIHFLIEKMRVSQDAALAVVLSSFFGIGVTLVSIVQFSFSSQYRLIQAYLYGQAATMTDLHILIYGLLSLLIILLFLLFFKEIVLALFDREYASTIGKASSLFDLLIGFLVVIAIVIGIRSVGVILMAAMLIAPPVAARQCSHRLKNVALLSSFFGLLSALLGNIFSLLLSRRASLGQQRFSLPTGPMIVLVAVGIALAALLFAPQRGILIRYVRMALFRVRCIKENILKLLWRNTPEHALKRSEIEKSQGVAKLYLTLILYSLRRSGLLMHGAAGTFQLTEIGARKGARLVRLHRLWELYLVHHLGVAKERVHANAEEIEHILTPLLEQQLTLLLDDPKVDPHYQPIPPRETHA